MSEVTEKTTIIIKGRFKAPAVSSFGLFIIFMDNSSKAVEKYDVVSSHFSTLYENNISMPWNELENIITKLKWKGEYATSLTHDVQSTFDDLFQTGTGRTPEIWSNIKKLQFNKVEGIFEEVLSRPAGDKNIKVDIAIETLPASQIESVRKNQSESSGKDILSAISPSQDAQPKQQKESYIPDDSAVLLEVSLVLSPVSGVPVYELKEGDKIFVKITEQSNRGQYFIDLLNASQDGEILPIPATVVKVTKEGKIYVVIVNIGPGIYGKSLDEDNVKVKMYDPMLDKRKQKGTIPAVEKQVQETVNIEKKAKSLEIPFHFIFIAIGIIAVLLLGMLILLMV
ncbi:MAG: DUF4899 domain-containing protein [Brevinematia bacterium]